MDSDKFTIEKDASQSSTKFQTEKDSKSSEITQNFKSDLQDSKITIESPTPEKPESRKKTNVITSLSKNLLVENFNEEKEKSSEIPEKYKDLINLFKQMEISIRFFSLRKKDPTFTNISAHIEIISKRKFTFRHLAQIKYLLPDIIEIERILLKDEKTFKMVPDLKIRVLKDSVKTLTVDQSFSVALIEAFISSLLNFIDAHPKDTEIPESELPEPFNPKIQNINITLKTLSKDSTSNENDAYLNASHFPLNFRETKSWKQNPELILKTKSWNSNPEFVNSSLEMLPLKPEETKVSEISSDVCKSPLQNVKLLSGVVTPNKEINLIKNDDVALTETPAQQTPKRALPTPNNNINNNNDNYESGKKEDLSEVIITRSARKSLFYTESKSEEEILNLNEGLGCESGVEDLNEKVTQIGEGKKDSLPLTFDTIYQISRSKDFSLITKRELVHKIISNNLEIEDPSEVEYHLKILEEMVPDCICKKSLDDGEVLYSVKLISDPEAVRASLVEAI